MADYDLIIIGSGAAGFSAATKAKNLGVARLAIIERGTLWGTCVNYGCVPSKFLITLADLSYYRNYSHEGLRVESTFDLKQALCEKKELIDRLLIQKGRSLLSQPGVDLFRGSAVFTSPHELSVGGQVLRAPKIIIATGSSPRFPGLEGIDDVKPMTSLEALDPGKIPGHLIVVGGRALALEFAGLYCHLGSKVTILQRGSSIIPDEEPEIIGHLTRYLMQEGITIRTGVGITGIKRTGDMVSVTAQIGGRLETITANEILFATGRSPNTRDLRLDCAGVTTGKNGEVLVNEYLQTSAPHIFAAGDVLGEPQLEPAAKVGGSIAAENLLAGGKTIFDRSTLPHAIFTTPQIARVGMTEKRAQEGGLDVTSRCTMMSALAKSSIMGDTRGLVKIVAETGTGRIVGVHICAPLASEMIQECVLAMKHRLTVEDIGTTFHIFPTATEAIWYCARAFRREPEGSCP